MVISVVLLQDPFNKPITVVFLSLKVLFCNSQLREIVFLLFFVFLREMFELIAVKPIT